MKEIKYEDVKSPIIFIIDEKLQEMYWLIEKKKYKQTQTGYVQMIRDIKIGQIAEGWFNHIKNQMGILDQATREVGEYRLKICEGCPKRKDNSCGICGCFLPAKVVSTSKCPDNPPKW